jgi:DNA-directed RNA polymerase subunit RPC12/RpoP
MRKERVKVNIRCKKCGERYILRGRTTHLGQVETGFKRCICNNDDDFDVNVERMP